MNEPNFKEELRYWLRNQQCWLNLRTRHQDGWRLVWARWRSWPRILKTRPVMTDPVRPGQAVAVHTICFYRDWLSAMWTLKSFYHHAQVQYPLVIHLQSEISPYAMFQMRGHFPAAQIITKEEADRSVLPRLAESGLPRCVHARLVTGMMYKLLDFQLLGTSTNILALDSDILFFRKPAELLTAGDAPLERHMFQEDFVSGYNTLTCEQARQELGVNLVPRLNAGLIFRPRSGVDLHRVEEFLRHPTVSRPTGQMEQLLQALCGSVGDRATYLPPSYALSMGGPMNCDELVCRHYAGPSRPWLTTEGIPHLVRHGFLKELAL